MERFIPGSASEWFGFAFLLVMLVGMGFNLRAWWRRRRAIDARRLRDAQKRKA